MLKYENIWLLVQMEKDVPPQSGLLDYKFMCLNGEVYRKGKRCRINILENYLRLEQGESYHNKNAEKIGMVLLKIWAGNDEN